MTRYNEPVVAGLRNWLVGVFAVGALLLPANGRELESRNHWLARTWQTDEGLPDNYVTGVMQTQDGHLWVSTLGGLMRFDGARFEEYSIIHLPKVINRNIRNALLDRRGRFWLVTDRGVLIRVEAKSARVFTSEDGFPFGRVAAMAEDEAGSLWMAVGNSFLRIEGDRIVRASEPGIPGGGGAWVAADEKGQLWLARGNQVCGFRNGRWKTLATLNAAPVRLVASRRGGLWICAGTGVFRFEEGKDPTPIGQLPRRAAVRVMMEDMEGRLWIGTTTDGLLVQQGKEFIPVPVSHPEILALKQDREGNIWVGTAGGGLNLLRPRAVELVSTRDGLPFESTRSVCEDSEGWIWVALQDGALARGRNAEWRAVTAADGWSGGNAHCVSAARDGGVWIGTRDRGLQRWKEGKTVEWSGREGLGSTWVRALRETRKGEVWLATDQPPRLCLFDGTTFRRFEVPEGTRSIRALAEGVDGILWAGTSDGRLFRLSGSELVEETFGQSEGPRSIRCLHAASDGSLWIGYAGWGVGRYREGVFSRLHTASGLFDDYIYQILADGKDGLWITSNHGLFQVPYESTLDLLEGRSQRVRSIAYGRNEGLPSVQSVCENTPTAWRGADGRMWFATRKGVLAVSPDRIRDNPTPPPVLLTRVSLDDRLLALYDSGSPLRTTGETNLADLAGPGVSLDFAPAHAKLEFEFTALSLGSPENVHFRYRLQGFDHEWVEAGPQRNAKYPRLPAGKYRFEVTACNEAGLWNAAGISLPFIVHPFLWQTWWFRAGVLLSFTGGVSGLVWRLSSRRLHRKLERMERQAELQRERTRIARDMHDEVGTKLSRLSLLSEMTRQQPQLPAEAQRDVAEISETARETIRSFEEIVWAVNPKNDSLANLVHYLCRFAEDFFEGSATQCVFELPEDIPAIALSTEVRHHLFLAAKEALNNALKYARARNGHGPAGCRRRRIRNRGQGRWRRLRS